MPDMTLGAIAATNREIRTAIGSERNAAFRTNRYLRSQYGQGAQQQQTQQPQQPQQQQQQQQPPHPGWTLGTGAKGYGWYPPGTPRS